MVMNKSFLLVFALLLVSCSFTPVENLSCDESNSCCMNEEIIKIEVFHFHTSSQCYSCITIGEHAEETINTYFLEEVENGKIIFDHINIDLLENREIVNKYGATASSLYIGTYHSSGFHAEENLNIWYKISNKEDSINYLKELFEQSLNGSKD
jgi:hypothetical protein